MNFNDSRWKKPDVYFTSIGIYFIICMVVGIVLFLTVLRFSINFFDFLILLGLSPFFIILYALSIYCVNRLLVKNRKDKLLSLTVLILWSFLISGALWMMIGPGGNPEGNFPGSIIYPIVMIVPNVMMYAFLIKGWNWINRENSV